MKRAILIGTLVVSLATAFACASLNAQNEPPLPWPSHVAEIIPVIPTANLA